MKFIINFSGYVEVFANSKEEAESILFDNPHLIIDNTDIDETIVKEETK